MLKHVSRQGSPIFTILTCYRNHEAYLAEWANSILSQSYRPLEVVLVDDCSDIDSGPLIEEWKEKFTQNGISFIYTRNSHRMYCGSSYAKALSLSSGSFLGVLDGDDTLVTNAVNFIMRLYMEYPEIDHIYSQFNICRKGGKSRGFCGAPQKGFSLLQSELSPHSRHCYSHWRTFSRIDGSDTVFCEGLRCAVDKFMGYRLEEIGKGMFANKRLYNYRSNVPKCITATESSVDTWKAIRTEFFKKRKKNKIKTYPIVTLKKKNVIRISAETGAA